MKLVPARVPGRAVLAAAVVGAVLVSGGTGAVAGSLITAKEIKDDAVRSRHLKDGTVRPADLGSEVQGLLADPGAAVSDENYGGSVQLPDDGTMVVSEVDVTVDRPGNLVAYATGTIEASGGMSGSVGCALSSSSSPGTFSPGVIASVASNPIDASIADVARFPVDEAGTYTVSWTCFRQAGAAAKVFRPNLVVSATR